MRWITFFLILTITISFIESATIKYDKEEELRRRHRKKKKRPCKMITQDGRTFLFVGDIVVNQIASSGVPVPVHSQGGGPIYSPILAEGDHDGTRPGIFPCLATHFAQHTNRPGGGIFGSNGIFSSNGLFGMLGIPSLFSPNGWFAGIAQSGLGFLSGGNGGNTVGTIHIPPQADIAAAPVHEDAPHDEVEEDHYYKPGAVVGAPSQDVNGYMQAMFNRPQSFVKGVGKSAYNYLVNPFVQLLQRRR